MARRMKGKVLFYLCQLADSDEVFVDIRVRLQAEKPGFVLVFL